MADLGPLETKTKFGSTAEKTEPGNNWVEIRDSKKWGDTYLCQYP